MFTQLFHVHIQDGQQTNECDKAEFNNYFRSEH